jgi:molybdopterin synthase catalytic subunit
LIQITLLFLGPARDFAGVESAERSLEDGCSIVDLRGILAELYPQLAPALHTIRFAVNQRFATDATTLADGDEVALIPPVSGGSDDPTVLVDLVNQAIDAQAVRSFVLGDALLGGIVTFEGATRRDADTEEGCVVRLDYEAYDAMARVELARLADEVKTLWSVGRVAIVHRIGPVPVGEVSVMIAVACGHRAEAFEACRWLIDTLKKDVPIWKKDIFESGREQWVDPIGES